MAGDVEQLPYGEGDRDVLLERDVVERSHLFGANLRGVGHDEAGAALARLSRHDVEDLGVLLGGDQDPVLGTARHERMGDLRKRLAHHVLMILADVGDDSDGRLDDLLLADSLVPGIDCHALHDDGVDERGHPVAHHFDLLENGRGPAAIDRVVLPVGGNHRGERARRLADGEHAGFAQHPGDQPGHRRLAPDPVDVDTVGDHGEPAGMAVGLAEPTQHHGEGSRCRDCEEDELCRHGWTSTRCIGPGGGPT